MIFKVDTVTFNKCFNARGLVYKLILTNIMFGKKNKYFPLVSTRYLVMTSATHVLMERCFSVTLFYLQTVDLNHPSILKIQMYIFAGRMSCIKLDFVTTGVIQIMDFIFQDLNYVQFNFVFFRVNVLIYIIFCV